ncbi:MAG: hypothetical protein KAY59_08800 [Acidobacteria bacterium]|nr:hypothetical protein [Acidobacteriota bacterium]
MDSIREKILEDQVDALAGQLSRLQEQMSAVVEIFRRSENAQLLTINSSEAAKLMIPTMAAVGASRHAVERNTQHRMVELDQLLAERRRSRT